jgi:deoxyribonuclease V
MPPEASPGRTGVSREGEAVAGPRAAEDRGIRAALMKEILGNDEELRGRRGSVEAPGREPFAPSDVSGQGVLSPGDASLRMIACVDVHYEGPGARAACVLLRGWGDGDAAAEIVVPVDRVEPYEPGRFYRRELPCLLAVLGRVTEPVEVVIVDGYVWLQDGTTPGLGAHLYEALGRHTPVIGVAKTRFEGASAAVEVVRGDSRRPLFVTAAGVGLEDACRRIHEMHGPFRLPTALRRVDQLCRGIRGAAGMSDDEEVGPRG